MMKQFYNLLLLAAFWSRTVSFKPRAIVENCPTSCHCMLIQLSVPRDTITVKDCVTEPGSELYMLLHQHNDIRYLIIQRAGLSSVGNISYLKQLEYLDLRYNNLTLLPCALSMLPKLSQLYLSHNSIQTVECDLSQLVQLDELHLEYNKLKSVPCELSKLPELNELYLSYNSIQTADCDLSQLNKLNVLYLHYNNLKSVPCELSKLPKLKQLHLRDNTIETVDCDMLELKELEYLELDSNNLKSLPCQLSKLAHLRSLDLSYNAIHSVECDMSQLTDLELLYLHHNKLTSVPCELSMLIELHSLYLSHNEIQTIDCELSELDQLLNLYLDNNRLKSVPCNLPQMSELHLSHNDIETVDCDILNLGSVEHLYLDYNRLRSVPCELLKLLQLSVLHLSHNNIETANCEVSHMIQLHELALDYNMLKSFPCELSMLPLCQLSLSHNYIENIECNIMGILQQNCSLDISHNNLTTLPLLKGAQRVDVSNNAIRQFTNKPDVDSSCEDLPIFYMENNNITHLMGIFVGWGLPINKPSDYGLCVSKLTQQFSGNPLVCDCIDYRFYHFLQRNVIPWTNPCYSPLSLKDQNPVLIPLDQLVCDVLDQCPDDCSCVSVPASKVLRVSCNAYAGIVLPENLPTLEDGNLYELYFKGSHLTSLPFRSYFINTAKAIFSNSSITELTAATLEALAKNIKVFHLNNNKLRRLPENIALVEFEFLVELRLYNNPWHCDCHALLLRGFVLVKKIAIKNVSLIRCHSPTEVANKSLINLARSYFCDTEGSEETVSITVIATTCTLLLLVSVSIYILKSKQVIERVPFNIEQQERYGVVDEQDDEGKEFDIFVSYATEDEEYAGEWLIPELERRGFKVCFHRVHFLGGVPIHVNMHRCINKSKRMLAFFSKNFLESHYSRYEFDLALGIDIDSGTRRLVTIKESTLKINTLTPSYAAYFETHTYIEQGAVNFWRNLLFTMPENKLGQVAEAEVDEHAV